MNKYVFLYLFTFLFLSLNAQPDLKFTRYTTDDGLAYNDVLCICQDSFGFIWFGTKYGCSRFDGIEFKNYQYNEDISGSIGYGWVNQIISDNQNRLWFAITGPRSTFMKYDYETDKFIDVSSLIKKQLNIKDKLFSIWSIFTSDDEYIWMDTPDRELIGYNANNDSIKTFNYQNDVKEKNPPVQIFSKNDIWFNTWLGIFIYNKEKDSFTNYVHNPNNPLSLSSDKCNKIFHDSQGDIWIATDNGLNKVAFSSSGTLTFEHFKHEPQNPFSLSSNLVYDIAEDNNGNLLIATVNGLCLMDKETNRIYRYFNNEIDNESINSNLVRAVYKDNQGNIWIATNAGVGKLQMKNFKSYSQSFYKNSISHNKVQYFCEAPNSNVWIATPKGIDVFDRKREKFNFTIGITQNENGLYGAPLVLSPSADNGIWIGTWNGGLSHFNHATNKITNYITKPEMQEMTSIFSVFTDSKDNLWFSVNRNGFCVYNKKSGEYKNFSYDVKNENTLSSNSVYSIIEDSDSDIWIGTLNGLNLLIDFENAAFKCYLNGQEIKCIFEGSDKNLWIGASIGLCRFNKSSQLFKKYDINDGLPSNTILGILEDSLHNLWVSTDKGIAKLILHGDSIAKVTVYHKEDGIEVGEFLSRSCVKLSDGTMMFGGTEGFCMFHPSEIKNDTLLPKIIFTNLKVANEIVGIGQEINGQTILRKSITTTKQLTLNHKNNAFSIQFVGLQYNMPQHTQYCYRLEGHDPVNSEWHYTNSADRYAEYMNLPPGNYTFKVKAANSYGAWNNQPAELEINILSPWWLTFWFISLMVILFVLFIVVIVRIRTYNLHKQKQKLEKIVEQRTTELKEMNIILNERKEELETQMEQMARMNKEIKGMAKRLHEADQSKIRFFANVSHEFRTPLSLIIAPLEKLLSLQQPILWNKINISDYHQLMHKNSKRLLRLINQVIDFRKIEQGGKQLNISNNNIVKFTKEVIDAFSTLSELKNISLRIKHQYPLIDFMFDPDVLEKILYNLISNAIKYTPKGGEVSIQLSVISKQSAVSSEQSTVNSNQSYDSPLNTDNYLLITVKDTGIGINKENLDKIFNRFYREETNENYTIEGTGIGLAYTKELVELHKGNISVESELDKGTTFIIKFPINNEIYGKEAVIKDTPVNLDYTRSMIESVNDIPKFKSEKSDINVNEIIEDNSQEKKSNILIVEDNTELRKFIKNELLSHFNVYEANNGKEGLELATQKQPELIISDIMMPVMNGIELCERIKTDENTSHIPLILLTAKGSDNDQIQGLETGADDYITKPFNIDILKIKINNLFALRKRMREKFGQSINVVPSEITHSLIDQKFLQKAIEIINKNIQNYDFDNDTFADLMGYSRALVYKKIKNLTGGSVSEFIRNIRLKASAKLFLEGHDNVAEVCYLVGFKDPSVLTRHFKKMFGSSPREFIKESIKK